MASLYGVNQRSLKISYRRKNKTPYRDTNIMNTTIVISIYTYNNTITISNNTTSLILLYNYTTSQTERIYNHLNYFIFLYFLPFLNLYMFLSSSLQDIESPVVTHNLFVTPLKSTTLSASPSVNNITML